MVRCNLVNNKEKKWFLVLLKNIHISNAPIKHRKKNDNNPIKNVITYTKCCINVHISSNSFWYLHNTNIYKINYSYISWYRLLAHSTVCNHIFSEFVPWYLSIQIIYITCIMSRRQIQFLEDKEEKNTIMIHFLLLGTKMISTQRIIMIGHWRKKFLFCFLFWNLITQSDLKNHIEWNSKGRENKQNLNITFKNQKKKKKEFKKIFFYVSYQEKTDNDPKRKTL